MKISKEQSSIPETGDSHTGPYITVCLHHGGRLVHPKLLYLRTSGLLYAVLGWSEHFTRDFQDWERSTLLDGGPRRHKVVV